MWLTHCCPQILTQLAGGKRLDQRASSQRGHPGSAGGQNLSSPPHSCPILVFWSSLSVFKQIAPVNQKYRLLSSYSVGVYVRFVFMLAGLESPRFMRQVSRLEAQLGLLCLIIYLCMCLCIDLFVRACAWWEEGRVGHSTWGRSKDNFTEALLFFQLYVGSRDQTQGPSLVANAFTTESFHTFCDIVLMQTNFFEVVLMVFSWLDETQPHNWY